MPSAEQDTESPEENSEVLEPSGGKDAEPPGRAHLGALRLLGQAATTRSHPKREAPGPRGSVPLRVPDLFLWVRLGSPSFVFYCALRPTPQQPAE